MPASRDLMEGMRGLDNATEQYVRAWTYYAGDLPETFSAERIRQYIEKTSQDYRFRLAKIPVNALANRLSVASIVSSAGEAVNRRIEEIREANDMELQEAFLTKRMLAFGDSYLFVWPVEEDEDTEQRDGESVDAQADEDTRSAGIELAYQSPLNCRAFYDSEDGRRIRFVIRRWKEITALGEIWRAEVWYMDRMEPWKTRAGTKGTDENDWLPYAEDEEGEEVPADENNWPVFHEFEEIPIKHARNDLPYGRSELSDFIGPQNAITKAVATQASELESHGWRERYRIADDKTIVDQANDLVNWGDSTDAPAAEKAPVSGRRRGPGTEQTFYGTKGVGEFSTADPGELIDPIEQWVRLGSVASETPLTEFDPRFGASMSGIARLRADAPMRSREKTVKRFLLRFWREVYGLALRMSNIDPGVILVNWEPPEVVSDPEWWSVATTRRDHGVPQDVILREANYSEEEIIAWLDEQGEEVFLDQRIRRLHALGEAMQTLGAGATLLGIEEARVAALVERILGEAGAPRRIEGAA